MTAEQLTAAALVGAALVLFAWGRWRYDVVALLVLLGGVAAGVIPAGAAFAGFGHPAVVTVAAVLIISRALGDSGVMERLAARLAPADAPFLLQLGVLCAMVAVLSMFMNNVGALAIVMPLAIASARKVERSPACFLMPVSFASMLGGMVTLIGTPPNIVISSYRAQALGEPFGLFDFAPVGGAVAAAGLVFIVFAGWRLIPTRGKGPAEALLGVKEYLTEVRPKEEGKAVGLTMRELDEALAKHEVGALSITRGKREIPGFAWWERVREGDVILTEGGPDAIAAAVKELDLELAGEPEAAAEHLEAGGNEVLEAVVQPHSLLVGLTAEEMRLRSRYSVNLLAVARQGSSHRGRLKAFRFAPGDVMFLQGAATNLNEAARRLGVLPLAARDLQLGEKVRPALTVGIIAAALAAVAFGLASAPVALTAGAVALVLTNVLRLRRAYEAIDWPVVVVLGAMIPVGGALESTGTTALIAESLAAYGETLSPAILIGVLMVLTMTLSDVINNAATAVMMAPIAASLAAGLGAQPDAFLMAVAIGASCAFLTPIGHQNNTLVMGPGGYRFWDYWRMGLPMEILIVAVAIPMLLLVWPV